MAEQMQTMRGMGKPVDREQARENLNALRVAGGLLVIVALLLYFFHMAEARFGHILLGVLAAALAVAGVALLVVGWWKLRALR